MLDITQQAEEAHIELTRSTGFHGREPWVAQLDRDLGTAIATLRQLEVCTSQMACVCLEAESNQMDNRQTWEFLALSFLPRLRYLAERLDQAVSALEGSAQPLDDRRCTLIDSWRASKSAFARATVDQPAPDNCDELIFPILFATLVLQGLGFRAADPERFTNIGSTTKLAPVFLQACCEALGWRPYGADLETSLPELAERLSRAA